MIVRGKVQLNRTEGQDSGHVYSKTTHKYSTDPSNIPVTSSTFWKSPYTGEGQISAVLRTKPLMRPASNVSTTAQEGGLSCTDLSPRLTVKSILKHRQDDDMEEHSLRDEFKTRPKPEQMPNLITTGTGKGRPHGSPVRSKTAGAVKRVQFSNKGQLLSYDRAILNGLSPGPYQGRRLFLDRATSTRILGDPHRSIVRNQNQNKTNNLQITLNGAETNIKSQIQSFIRKLRIAENDRVSMIGSEVLTHQEPNAQQKTAVKLRKSHSYSGHTLIPDWAEFDLDKITPKPEINDEQSVVQKTANDNSLCNVYDSKSRVSSDSVSLESFSTVHEDSVFERSPGGAKIFRPKPNASLYTKYRHITTNDVNKYGIDYNETRNNNSKNFCDKRKTKQILGWLDGVRNAQALVDTNAKLPDSQSGT